jgi:hypothetical protein
MQLSKSDYMLFRKHPAWLWLKKHEPEKLPPIDAATQAIFDAGHAFEVYAEKLFTDGVTLGFDGYEQYKTLPSRTSNALDSGAKTIFQGRFEHGELTFICDIIQIVEGNIVDLYEIKSSTSAKDDHVYDLAFQAHVLELCGYSVRKAAVIHVNNQYVRDGEIDHTKLTAITDVTEQVQSKKELTAETVERALSAMHGQECPDISPVHASNGSFRDWFVIYKQLVDAQPGSVYDLCSMNAATLARLEQSSATTLASIPDDFALNGRQSLQVRAAKQGKPIIQPDKVKVFLDSLEFPLYFFDYETMMSTVPYFDGMQPYKQYPFQYSLHVLESPESDLHHYEYLHTESSDPCGPLSEMLQSHIGDKGCVITWNMSFEKGCNDTLAKMCPDYADFYEKLNERIVDLKDPFSNNWYVDSAFNGSASLKAVLPVIVPSLSYQTLGIQEGGAAQRLWMEAILDGKHGEEKDQIIKDLLEYCKLDTLAMVEIYKKLKSL